VGLDYFSSLAYLPSIAISRVGQAAPLAAVAVIVVTLLAALPVYFYVVGRSPHGRGGVGLLEQCVSGWGGKLLLLVLLGFVATDFVLTRSLSVSDAATHVLGNPYYQEHAGWVKQNREAVRGWFPEALRGGFFDFWNEQLVLAVGLSVLAFALYFWLVRNLSRGFLGTAVAVVILYVLLNVIVIASGLVYVLNDAALARKLNLTFQMDVGDLTRGGFWAVLALAMLYFPPMAIGLSGFELSMATAPMVRGSASDTELRPAGRIRHARLLMIAAAVIMSLLVLGSVSVVSALVPASAIGEGAHVQHRTLAYLAHGQPLVHPVQVHQVSPLFGPAFGTLYDLSTVLVLCLAGASATISLKEIVPEFLSRFGMQLAWAHKIDVITHLFNGVILIVTVWFQASVTNQQWAYAASVLALLFGAALAATLDVVRRWPGSIFRWVLLLPFAVIATLFGAMLLLVAVQQWSGVAIALLFVIVVLVTAIVSRWLRSTELRFEGFEYKDEPTQTRWQEVCRLEFQVLVPHSPGHMSLHEKEAEIRVVHRLAEEVPIIFIEAQVGDPSDFFQKPLMTIEHEGGREVIRLTRCTSVAHVVAAIGLAFREVGRPPEIHFGWSDESPMAANLSFLLLGQGNVPWMVQSLLRHAEPDPTKRPRVVIG
jgi:hypothetical protein